MATTHKIVVCMGSSCFSRGNRENLELIKNWLAKNNCQAEVRLEGTLCCDQCGQGPNISVDGTTYTMVDNLSLVDILENLFKKN